MADDLQVGVLEIEPFMRAVMGIDPTPAVASQLAAVTRHERYRPDDTIHRAGDGPGLVHLLVHGDVELRATGAAPTRVEAPASLGLVDFLRRRPHIETAVAAGEVRALVFDGDDWLDVLEENVEFTHAVIAHGATRLLLLQMDLAPSAGFPHVAPEGASGGESGRLTLVERILALRKTGAFSGGGVYSLAVAAKAADEIVVSPGQVLRRQGDPARSIFVVANGILRAERASPTVRARFGPGSIVGGIAALGCAEHPYTYVAESPAVLLRLHHDLLFDLVAEQVDLLRSVLAELATERERLLELAARRAPSPRVDAAPHET